MRLDDEDRARLARIEQQLADTDPALATALEKGRPLRSRKLWLTVLVLAPGIVFAGLAVALTSMAWGLLAAITLAGCWIWLREGRPVLSVTALDDQDSSPEDVR